MGPSRPYPGTVYSGEFRTFTPSAEPSTDHHSCNQFLQLVPLHFLRRFNILPLIPLNSGISYPDLAAASGTHEPHLRRLLRLSFAVGFLEETAGPPVNVRHNVSSALLLRNPFYMDILGFMTEYVSKSTGGIMDAMDKDPMLGRADGAGFNSVFGVERQGFLEWIHSDSAGGRNEAARIFKGTMEGMVEGNPGFGHEFIVKGWRWEVLRGVRIVDVSLGS